ncbi:hypothetical protein AMTRI_Chr02g221000 [Amborella trichopoda]
MSVHIRCDLPTQKLKPASLCLILYYTKSSVQKWSIHDQMLGPYAFKFLTAKSRGRMPPWYLVYNLRSLGISHCP